MRQQHDVVHPAQFRWYIRLVGEHIQSGARQLPPDQQFDEGILINDASPCDIDDVSVRSKSFQHCTAHQVLGARAASGGNHEHIDGLSQFNRQAA